jgi:hypothetical protein
METGFAVTAFLSVILNLMLPEEIEDEETPELTAATIDNEADQAEWAHIRRKSQAVRQGSDITPNGTDIEKSADEKRKAAEAST